MLEKLEKKRLISKQLKPRRMQRLEELKKLGSGQLRQEDARKAREEAARKQALRAEETRQQELKAQEEARKAREESAKTASS